MVEQPQSNHQHLSCFLSLLTSQLSLSLRFDASVSVGIDFIWIYLKAKSDHIQSPKWHSAGFEMHFEIFYYEFVLFESKCRFDYISVVGLSLSPSLSLSLSVTLTVHLFLYFPSFSSQFRHLSLYFYHTQSPRIYPLCSLWIITQTSVLDNPKMFEIMLIYNWILNFELNIQFILLYIKQIYIRIVYIVCVFPE